MRYYTTDREFKQALEREMQTIFSYRAWELVQDFLFTRGIHPPCDDEDVKKAKNVIEHFRGVISE